MARPNRRRVPVREPAGLDLRRTEAQGGRRRIRVGERIQIDHQDAFHTKYKKPHFMTEAEFAEFRERNPGVVKLLMENPGCEETIFKQFKAEETRAALRADIRKKIQEQFEISVPWPNGWTNPGPEAKDVRAKAPADLYGSYLKTIEEERMAYEQSIEQQQERLEQLRSGKVRFKLSVNPKRFIGTIRGKIERRRDIRRATQSLAMTKGLRADFHNIVDHTETRLRIVFEKLQSEMELNKGSELALKKLQVYYIPELNAAIREYNDMRHLIGSAINGKSWLKANARQNARFGFTLTPMSQLALKAYSSPAAARKVLASEAEKHGKKQTAIAEHWNRTREETNERVKRVDAAVKRAASRSGELVPAGAN